MRRGGEDGGDKEDLNLQLSEYDLRCKTMTALISSSSLIAMLRFKEGSEINFWVLDVQRKNLI